LSELEFILDSIERAGHRDDAAMRHLASPLCVSDYIRIADTTSRAMRGARLLDWGCGYGQLSYLLTRRGVEVTAYDTGSAIVDSPVPRTPGMRAVCGTHPYHLPFRSGAFDGVLACGVLEHVVNMGESLDEIRRVLVPRGQGTGHPAASSRVHARAQIHGQIDQGAA
jgi:2-polyprenyl-3-methyl-5-hydroxy-6-metoxy-1,4-benzoquinol methylase